MLSEQSSFYSGDFAVYGREISSLKNVESNMERHLSGDFGECF